MKRNLLWGAFLCLIASMSWGAMFPVANHSFQYVEPFYFTIFRYIPVVVILVIILLYKEGKKALLPYGKGFLLWFYGTMGFTVYNLLIFFGQDLLGESGVLVASIMEASMPMISVFIFWFFKKQRPSFYTLAFIGIAFVGVFLVVTNGDISVFTSTSNQLIPVIILFIAVIGWVVYTMGGGSFSDWSALRYSTLTCLYGTATATVLVFLTTVFGWVEAPTLAAIHSIRFDLIFMVIFPGLFALLGWNHGVSILTPINGILFINFAPITTLVIGFMQGYDLTAYDIVGTTLIITALLLNNLYQRYLIKRRTSPSFYDNKAA